MKNRIRINISLVALLVFLIGLLLPGCENKQEAEMLDLDISGEGSNAVPVKVVKPKRGSIRSYIETTTTLEADKKVDVVSRTAGPVTEIRVEEGDRVKKNQLLLRIDNREAKAAYKAALATYEERKRQWERARQNYKKKIVSREIYDQAQYNYDKAEADLEASRVRLEYTSVQAPFDGVITKRQVHPGSMLSVNQQLFTIVDNDPLLARIHLPEQELPYVRKGQKAELKVEASKGRKFESSVKMINPVVDPASGTFKVTLEIINDNPILRPGLFATVYLVTETRENTLLIPKQALLLEAERDTIYYIDYRFAYTREIKVGFRDDKNIEVLSGLKGDEWLVVVGQDGLNNGSEVKLFDIEGKELPMPKLKEDQFDEDVELDEDDVQ